MDGHRVNWIGLEYMRYGRVGNVIDQQHVDMWVKVSYFPFLFFSLYIVFLLLRVVL
jgi:hypothetical protein